MENNEGSWTRGQSTRDVEPPSAVLRAAFSLPRDLDANAKRATNHPFHDLFYAALIHDKMLLFLNTVKLCPDTLLATPIQQTCSPYPLYLHLAPANPETSAEKSPKLIQTPRESSS